MTPTYSFNIYALPPAVTAVGFLLVGVVVLINERASRISTALFFIQLAVSLWLCGLTAMYCATNEAVAMWWARLHFLAIPFIPSTIYLGSVVVMGIYARRKRLIWAGLLLSAFFSAAALGSDVMVASVHRYWWGYYPRYGWLGIPFLVFFFGLALANLRDYWVEYRKADPGTHKLRLRALLIAFNFAYLGSFDYLPCYGVALYPFGYLPVFVCLALTARVAQRYRLVDIVPAFAANEILATMADPLAVCDADGRIRVVNQALCATLGYTQQELLGEPIECLAGADANGVERLRQLLWPGTARDEETVLRTQAGEAVPVSISLSPLQDGRRNRLGTVLIARDVREQKRAEAALRASEERFRLITETIGEVFWMGDAELAHTFYVSPAYERIWGRTPESIYQNTSSFIDAIHPEDREHVLADLAVVKSGQPFDHEYRIIRPDGSVLWIWSRGFPVHEPAGHISRYVGVAQDITERRRAEEALKLHGTIVDTMSEGVCLVRATDAAIIYANPRFEAMFGYGLGELDGRPVATLNASDEQSAEAVAQEIIRALKTNGVWRGEVRNRKKDGTQFWCQASVSTFQHSQHGDVWVAVDTDITERKHAEQIRQRHAYETAILSEMLSALNAQQDTTKAFPVIGAGLQKLSGCDFSALALFGADNDWMTLYALGPEDLPVEPGARLRVADMPAAKDVLSGRPHVATDLASQLDFPAMQLVYAQGYRSSMALPLHGSDGISGMLGLLWRRPGGLDVAQLPLLGQVADALALAMEKSRLFEQVSAAHKRLQTLAKRLIEVQETERRHIARELHDEIGQHLTGINFLLGAVEHLSVEGAVARLKEVRALVDGIIARVRDVSLDLRPAMLDDFGVLTALSWLFGRYTAQTGITVAFKHRALQQRFTAEQETAVYRIVQEALTNVARHAGVGSAKVEAWADGDTLGVSITDQGAGFDVDAVLANGMTGGLAGLRERAMLLGGRLTVESKPGAGTRLIAELPLSSEPGFHVEVGE